MKLNYYINKLNAILATDYDDEIPDRSRSKAFYKAYTSMIKKICTENSWKCIPHEGYCEAAGFITDGNHFIYYNSGDYRWSYCPRYKQEWKEHVLVRIAKNEEDYRGGSNTYIDLEHFVDHVKILLNVNKY